MKNGFRSYWLDSTAELHQPGPVLTGDVHADVVIVGAGYTGLWTAYWLTKNSPDLDVVVLDQQHVGFGASGRNGGWVSGKGPGVRRHLLAAGATEEGLRQVDALCRSAVYEITDLMKQTGHDVDAHLAGYIQVARSDSELARVKAAVQTAHDWGGTDDDVRLLSPAEAAEYVHVDGLTGALLNSHAARVNPAKLVHAVAALCRSNGVRIFEHSRVLEVDGNRVTTPAGTATADTVVIATEGYSALLPDHKRQVLPMVSSMVVTNAISDADWQAATGWSGPALMNGTAHTYFYAQRTPDNRIAIGGTGNPYHFGSMVDDYGRLDDATIAALSGVIQSLFPSLRFTIDHAWCGSLGIPRDWSPFVDVSQDRRTVHVGGYVGQGVAAAYVAGRTVADLLTDQDSAYTTSPWIRSRPRRWEPEPLRWIGSRAIYAMYHAADKHERITGSGQTSFLARAAARLSGDYRNAPSRPTRN